MATQSTVPTVKARLVTVFTTALATSGVEGGQVAVHYAWPGVESTAEMVFLGRHPELVGDPFTGLAARSAIPNMKAGRKQRQESYDVEATIWSFSPDLTAEAAATAEQRAFTIFGEIEDVLADTPKLGLTTGIIQRASIEVFEVGLIPFEKGWASVIVPTIKVEARLT